MVRKTDMIVPFSLLWHDEEDLMWGHLEMPLNADDQGPETDPAKVVRTVCWCWRGEKCEVIPPQWTVQP
jgi:hypothetical protein